MRKTISKFVDWVDKLLKDEKGAPSSKRIMGLVSGFSLCIALFLNIFTDTPVDGTLVNAVAALAFGALGLTSMDKFWSYKSTNDKKEE
jgi:hypothetical protein